MISATSLPPQKNDLLKADRGHVAQARPELYFDLIIKIEDVLDKAVGKVGLGLKTGWDGNIETGSLVRFINNPLILGEPFFEELIQTVIHFF